VNFSRLLTDHILVRLEPMRTQTKGGIIIPDTQPRPLRLGTVLLTGPGRYRKVRRRGTTQYDEVWRPVEAAKGDRVAFFIASVDTKSGQAVTHYLQEDQRIIREDDILFLIPDGIDVEVTQ
jgi:co-chaperonin GroES (HSP10)